MIECDLRRENCFHWYHSSCVGITPVNDRHLESQGEPFVCPFCTTELCSTPFSASNAPNFTWGSTSISRLVFVKRSIRLMSPFFTGYTISFWFPAVVLALSSSVGSHFVNELAKLYESFSSAYVCYGVYCSESCHGATCSSSPETLHGIQSLMKLLSV